MKGTMQVYAQGFPGAVELNLLFSPGGQFLFACLHVRVYAFTGDRDIAQKCKYRNFIFWGKHRITLIWM